MLGSEGKMKAGVRQADALCPVDRSSKQCLWLRSFERPSDCGRASSDRLSSFPTVAQGRSATDGLDQGACSRGWVGGGGALVPCVPPTSAFAART